MTSDARISTALPQHPKTKKLIKRLGHAGAWHLVCLILWAAANRPDGNLAGMSVEDVELAVDWSGVEGALVEALCSVGFLDGAAGEFVIHDWSIHNPWAAGSQKRSEKSRFAALCKQHGRGYACDMMPEYSQELPECTSGMPESANGMPKSARRTPNGAIATPAADVGSAPSPNPSPLPPPTPFPGEQSSLRSDSQPASPANGPTTLDESKSERLRQVFDDAMTAYNRILAKPHGLLPAVSTGVGHQKRQNQLKRCLPTVREICQAQFGSTRIIPDFWVMYFDECAVDDFFSGRRPGGKGHEDWTPDFEYLTRASTILKVYDKTTSESVA